MQQLDESRRKQGHHESSKGNLLDEKPAGAWEADEQPWWSAQGRDWRGFLFDLTSGNNFTLSIQARQVIHLASRLGTISRTTRALKNKLRFISSVSEERSILFKPFVGAWCAEAQATFLALITDLWRFVEKILFPASPQGLKWFQPMSCKAKCVTNPQALHSCLASPAGWAMDSLNSVCWLWDSSICCLGTWTDFLQF